MTWQSLRVVLVVAVIMLGFIAQVRAADYDLIEVSEAAYYHYTSDRIQDQTLLAPRFFFLSIWNYGGANSASVTITAEKEIAKTNPQPDVLNPPTYRWSFHDIPIQSYRQVRVTMNESVPTTLGFNAERTVSKDNFTHEDYQETTVTVALTGKSSALGVTIHTPFNSTSLSASIANSSSGAELLQPSEGLPLRVSWNVKNPSAGTTYTFRVTMELTPRSGAVRFVPSVLIFTSEERQTIAQGAEISAVSRVIGLGKVEVEFPKPCTWYMYYTRYPCTSGSTRRSRCLCLPRPRLRYRRVKARPQQWRRQRLRR